MYDDRASGLCAPQAVPAFVMGGAAVLAWSSVPAWPWKIDETVGELLIALVADRAHQCADARGAAREAG